MDEPRELQTLLPDEIAPAIILDRSSPLLSEITSAVIGHYRIGASDIREKPRDATVSAARGLIIVLARRYTRLTYHDLGLAIGCRGGNATAQYSKTCGRLDVNELLRDDRDIIERRLADIVIARTGGARC